MHFEMNQLASMTNHTEDSPNFIPHKASISLNITSILDMSVSITTTK